MTKDRRSQRYGLAFAQASIAHSRPCVVLAGVRIRGVLMLYLALKAGLSALIIVAVSEIAKRSPGFAALVASLPLISVLGMIWLWRDTGDPVRMAAHAEATFWYVLPSLPMFLIIPALLRAGVNFYIALAIGVLITIALYLAMTAILTKFGVRL